MFTARSGDPQRPCFLCLSKRACVHRMKGSLSNFLICFFVKLTAFKENESQLSGLRQCSEMEDSAAIKTFFFSYLTFVSVFSHSLAFQIYLIGWIWAHTVHQHLKLQSRKSECEICQDFPVFLYRNYTIFKWLHFLVDHHRLAVW